LSNILSCVANIPVSSVLVSNMAVITSDSDLHSLCH
jgi:hypothetical protein